MAEKTMKEALDDWEKEANKLIEETKKVSTTASKNLDKQLKTLQDEGAKLIDSLKKEDDEKLRKDLEKRYNIIKDKLTRAWNELKK
jgi:DNA anti-recombination protein RmuC